MPTQSLTIDQAVTLLAETPPRLSALTSGLTPVQLRTPPTPDAWSATDVLAHLRACADVWGEAIATMLTEDQPTIRAVNPRTWMEQTGYPALDVGSSLAIFTTQRAELLAILAALPPAAWARTAAVRGAGAPRERTVLSYAQRMARHERTHLDQMARIVSAIQAPRRTS